jgi:hypothetical protein
MLCYHDPLIELGSLHPPLDDLVAAAQQLREEDLLLDLLARRMVATGVGE